MSGNYHWPADNSDNIYQDLNQRGGMITHIHNDFAVNTHLPGTWDDQSSYFPIRNFPKAVNNAPPSRSSKK